MKRILSILLAMVLLAGLGAVVASAADYTVTYNANAPAGTVTGLPDPQTKQTDIPLTLSTDVPVRTGWDFMGWSTSPAGPAAFAPGGTYSINATVILYAIWEPNTFPVAYSANAPVGSVTGLPDPQTKLKNVPLILSTDIPVRTGWAFLGWASSASGTAAFNPGDIYNVNAAATLYAVWQANTYTVRYNANGGSGAMADSAHTYDTPKALSSNTFTSTAGVFGGWATSPTGSAVYGNGHTVNNLTAVNGAVVDLYAVWKPANFSALNAKIDELKDLKPDKYTAETWAAFQAALAKARDTAANAAATQVEIDNALHELIIARNKLAERSFIFTTKYESNFLNWVLFILCFGWIWMWFA